MSKLVRWFGVAVPVVALAFAGYAVAEDKPAAKPEEKKPAAAKPAEEKPAAKEDKKAEGAKKDIVDTAVDAKFTILADLLKEAGLVETLKGKGPFTVFAPTDEAFNKLGKEMLESLKKDKAKLGEILKYHVVAGNVKAADVVKLDGKTTKTVNEKAEIKITVKDGKVMLNDKVNVTKTDVEASNGVIHVIDAVLLPATK